MAFRHQRLSVGKQVGIGAALLASVLAASLLVTQSTAFVVRDEGDRPREGGPARPAVPEFQPVPAPTQAAPEKPSRANLVPPKARAGFQGVTRPGGRVVLSAEGTQGDDLRYHWVQTQGPRAVLDSPDRPAAALIVPEPGGAEALGFVLTVANAAGIDSAAVTVPLGKSDGDAAKAAAADPPLKADAGDDQIALPGRQVTLNGVRSEPRGRIGYRWLQVAGPKVRLFLEDRYTYTFVPTQPGVYRFALVVASGSEVSEPDAVTVTVASAVASGPAPGPSADPAEPTGDLARRVVSSVRGGPEAAEALSEAFEAVADRMDLYQSYAEMFGEMSRRLETILPADPSQRGAWTERVFTPLSARLVERLAPEGLDLRRTESHSAELTLNQRARLAETLRDAAEGFRAAKAPRQEAPDLDPTKSILAPGSTRAGKEP